MVAVIRTAVAADRDRTGHRCVGFLLSSKYHFVLKAGNGEIIATSESYTTKAPAQNGIESVKANASNAIGSARFAKDGRRCWYWVGTTVRGMPRDASPEPFHAQNLARPTVADFRT